MSQRPSGDGINAGDRQFVFPQTGPFKPPDPPRPFTLANLDLTYQQASSLWPEITKQSCANALESHFADGDPSKAIVLIQFYRAAVEGYVTAVCRRNGSYLPLRGAINVDGVSCYVDSLLVAMFSRMENFEPLLYKRHYGDQATDRLATWLRLFVNLLRNGERITADIVAALMATAVAAGWASTTPLSQQDAAEFFVFITEKLLMPLLVLRVDIAHAGKEADEYDHKMIKEQLLYLPVPGTDQDPPILLEECFEIYFSNVINVSRHLSQPAQQRPQSIGQHPLMPALSSGSNNLDSPKSASPFPHWSPDFSPSPAASPAMASSSAFPISSAVPASSAFSSSQVHPNLSASSSGYHPSAAIPIASPPGASPFPEGPQANDDADSMKTPPRSSISGMASTVANWLSSSTTERAGGPTTRRRSYSILSLTSSPGFRKGSRTTWEDGYSASPSPSVVMSTPDPNNSGTGGWSNAGPSSASTIKPSFGTSLESVASPTDISRFPSSVHHRPQSPPGDPVDPLDESSSAIIDIPLQRRFTRINDSASDHHHPHINGPVKFHVPPGHGNDAAGTPLVGTPGERPGSLPSYHQLFGFNEDRQAEARVRDMKQSLWTSNNEVMLPAWMFLQLMPFYADNVPSKNEPIVNLEADEVAHHFRKARPVLGICLKRYYVDDHGQPQRNSRTVIIPEIINMPSFVADDSDHKQAFGKFKLVLESAILHRGKSIHSGHYCALMAEPLARASNNGGKYNPQAGAHTPDAKPHSALLPTSPQLQHIPLQIPPTPASPSAAVPSVSSPSSPPSIPNVATSPGTPNTFNSVGTAGSENNSTQPGKKYNSSRKWYLFDDLQPAGDRIKEVTYSEVFERESPYMLFYRMVSLEEEDNSGSCKMSTPFSGNSSNTTAASSTLRPPSSLSVSTYDPSCSRPPSRAPSPEPGKEKDKKKKPKFFRRHKEKERDKETPRDKEKSTKDYASKYREEKCSLM